MLMISSRLIPTRDAADVLELEQWQVRKLAEKGLIQAYQRPGVPGVELWFYESDVFGLKFYLQAKAA